MIFPTEPYRNHLTAFDQLITSREEVRAAFVAFALEKNRKATPHVEKARYLQANASKAPNAASLADMPHVQAALLTAAGISEKAAGHMDELDKIEVITKFIDNYLEKAGDKFVEELVFRYLLTCGDALGGSVRNLIGKLAERKFLYAVFSSLSLAGIRYRWLPLGSQKNWTDKPIASEDIETVKGISWSTGSRPLTVILNLGVPLIAKNVDICVFACDWNNYVPGRSGTCGQPELYLALGELKGGIDPAGADEHWKTAHSALDRVRVAFARENLTPSLFFVAAAIEGAMAKEIWALLQTGQLTNAGNLTNTEQMASLCHWLINL